MSDVKPLIIQVAHGGLGDHLFHSHLPRISRDLYPGRPVLLSRHSAFRSPDYYFLIWGLSVELTEEPGQVFDGPIPRGCNLLDAIMLHYGLDDGKRWHEPEISFTPSPIERLRDSVIYDPNFISFVGALTQLDVARYFLNSDVQPHFVMEPLSEKALTYGVRSFDCRMNELTAYGHLRQYADIIASCGTFVCLNSGGAVLAAALKKPAFVLYGEGQLPMFRHSRLHTYIQAGRKPTRQRADEICARFGSLLRNGANYPSVLRELVRMLRGAR